MKKSKKVYSLVEFARNGFIDHYAIFETKEAALRIAAILLKPKLDWYLEDWQKLDRTPSKGETLYVIRIKDGLTSLQRERIEDLLGLCFRGPYPHQFANVDIVEKEVQS